MQKITIALVGCCRIAYKHFEAIANNGFYQLVAVCDVVKQRAQKAAQKYKVPFLPILKQCSMQLLHLI